MDYVGTAGYIFGAKGFRFRVWGSCQEKFIGA